MAVKIRLRRMGQKKAPFYRIIVADSRSPRDGRFIEEIGTYDPTSVERLGGEVVKIVFLMELAGLKGRKLLYFYLYMPYPYCLPETGFLQSSDLPHCTD